MIVATLCSNTGVIVPAPGQALPLTHPGQWLAGDVPEHQPLGHQVGLASVVLVEVDLLFTQRTVRPRVAGMGVEPDK